MTPASNDTYDVLLAGTAWRLTSLYEWSVFTAMTHAPVVWRHQCGTLERLTTEET
jgi:hypothetical protein